MDQFSKPRAGWSMFCVRAYASRSKNSENDFSLPLRLIAFPSKRFACHRLPGGAVAGEPMPGADGAALGGAPEEGNWLPGVKSGPVPSSGTQPVPLLFRRMPGEHLILA